MTAPRTMLPADAPLAADPAAPGATPGGVLVGTTDLASAQLLCAEGSLLIDLRPLAAFSRSHLPQAVHRTDAGTWSRLLAEHPRCWVLLSGGTRTSCRRFARNLTTGCAVLQVVGPAAVEAVAAICHNDG